MIEPTDPASIGFLDVPVPASNGIGMVLMVVLFIGAAAYFMRRRSGK